MFDVGLSEIVVVMLVALIVIGPTRLPAVARTIGQWWGRLQRYVNRMKADVTTSMELEELRQMERRIKADADALERTVQQASNDLNHQVCQMEMEIDQPGQSSGKATSQANLTLPPGQS